MGPKAAGHVEGVDQINLTGHGNRRGIPVNRQDCHVEVEPRRTMTREGFEAVDVKNPGEGKRHALLFHATHPLGWLETKPISTAYCLIFSLARYLSRP